MCYPFRIMLRFGHDSDARILSGSFTTLIVGVKMT